MASLPLTGAAAKDRQATIGLLLASGIAAVYIALHIYAVFFLELSGWSIVAAVVLVPVLCWLNVGLFIVAHDCMHGSLAPGRPAVNRWVGRVALALYAGFWFDRFLAKHHAHHRHAGTADDPDFAENHPTRFWPWYLNFFREYFGLRELAVLFAIFWTYLLVLGAPPVNMLLFWGVPSILSSLQLFAFGTYLPHRHEGEAPGAARFEDRHRARSNDYPGWLSLLTCFHFGYHHEHHRAPQLPWWKLPAERRG